LGTVINRFRFHGIRKLNWIERYQDTSYEDHLRNTGLDQWIDLKPLTIIVGPNGGGKSTIIDLFLALSDATLWPTLPRENYPDQDFSGFDIDGPNFVISARFSRALPKDYSNFDFSTLTILAQGKNLACKEQFQLPKYMQQMGKWKTKIQSILDKLIDLKIEFFPAMGPLLANTLTDNELIEILNELSPHFPSVYANPEIKPFIIFNVNDAPNPGKIGVLYKDDLGQHSFVDRKTLPLGWLQLVSLLYFMRGCEDGSLILLDEPDRHLHSSLQRVMLDIIHKYQEQKKIQVIIATHSSVLLNPELIKNYNAKLLLAARGQLSELSDARQALDDLGVVSGDLVQSNGIIWVEGPSDRIYINTWLKLYAQSNNLRELIEGANYSIVSYGGALIKHLTIADNEPDKVNIRRINSNWYIVIDSDLTNPEQPLKEEKKRFFDEAESIKQEKNIWITDDYTIEAYLPNEFAPFIRRENGRLIVLGTKVELAKKFRNQTKNWENSFSGIEIPKRIGELYNTINNWQTPHEIIEPIYSLPLSIK